MAKELRGDNCLKIKRGKSIGQAIDDAMTYFFKDGYVKDENLSGHHLLFDLDTNKPLDHDITEDELSSGNYATIDQSGKPVKLTGIMDNDGNLYASFGWSNRKIGPEKPGLLERFVNWFRSDAKKSPAVRAWNNWKAFEKTAEARDTYLKKNFIGQKPAGAYVTGMSVADYKLEVAPQAEVQAEKDRNEATTKEKLNAEKKRFREQLDAAKAGDYGKTLQDLAIRHSRLSDDVVEASFDLDGHLNKDVQEIQGALNQFVECTLMLKLAFDNDKVKQQLEKNDGSIRLTLGREFIQNLETAKDNMTELMVYNECVKNGGKSVLEKIQSIASDRRREAPVNEELINLNPAEPDDDELDKSRESFVSSMH